VRTPSTSRTCARCWRPVEDALAVAFAFNATNRLADALGFSVPGPKAFEVGAKFLLARGYR